MLSLWPEVDQTLTERSCSCNLYGDSDDPATLICQPAQPLKIGIPYSGGYVKFTPKYIILGVIINLSNGVRGEGWGGSVQQIFEHYKVFVYL